MDTKENTRWKQSQKLHQRSSREKEPGHIFLPRVMFSYAPSMRRPPSNKLVLFSKAALDLQPPSGANSTGCTKTCPLYHYHIRITPLWACAFNKTFSFYFILWCFFVLSLSLSLHWEERRKIALKPDSEAMIKSESKANNTEERTEKKKKKGVFWSGAEWGGPTKSLFALSVELIKLI